jgi:hypothetical protein
MNSRYDQNCVPILGETEKKSEYRCPKCVSNNSIPMPYLLSEDETILCDEEEASFILGFNSLKYENDSDCSINEDVEEIYQYQKFSELEDMDATNPLIYDTDESCKASSQSEGFNELGKDEEHLRMVDSFVEEYELQMLPQRKMNRLRERLSSDCSMNTDDQNDSDAFNIEKVGKLTDSQCDNSSFSIFIRHWFVVQWCFTIELCESWELQQYHCHDEKEPNDDADLQFVRIIVKSSLASLS